MSCLPEHTHTHTQLGDTRNDLTSLYGATLMDTSGQRVKTTTPVAMTTTTAPTTTLHNMTQNSIASIASIAGMASIANLRVEVPLT